MPHKINNQHQDSVSEDIQQSNFSELVKKMIHQQLITKDKEPKLLWLNGLDNKLKTLKFLITSNSSHKLYTTNIVKQEIFVSSAFYQAPQTQLNNKELHISTQLNKSDLNIKENLSNSYGLKVEINLNSNKKSEYQASAILQSQQSIKQKAYMAD